MKGGFDTASDLTERSGASTRRRRRPIHPPEALCFPQRDLPRESSGASEGNAGGRDNRRVLMFLRVTNVRKLIIIGLKEKKS